MTTTFSISELSKEFGITTRSIRFYEDEGLLEPTRRGQNRIYSRRDRVRLMLILRGKRLGFSLAEIRELFELYDSNPTNSAAQLRQMLSIISEKKASLEQQLRDIAVVMEELETAESRCLKALQDQSLQTSA